MTVWREARVPAVLALAVGAVAGWATSGRYELVRGAIVLGVALGCWLVLGRTRGALWVWGALPLLVVAGWLGGTLVWDWALVLTALLFGVPIWGAMGGAREGVAVAGTYAILVGAIVAGIAPPWCALAVLTTPLAVRAARAGLEVGSLTWREWLLALNGQVLLGFLIKGMVR
jgi:hypothetical protein